MNYHLSTPNPSDYEQLASWITDAWSCSRWAGPSVPFPFDANDLPKWLSAGIGHSLTLRQQGQTDLLGFGQWFDKGYGLVRLARIIIAPNQRGKGLGRILCQQIMDNARTSMAVETFSLGVYRDNPAALATYLRLGFHIVEELSNAESLTLHYDL